MFHLQLVQWNSPPSTLFLIHKSSYLPPLLAWILPHVRSLFDLPETTSFFPLILFLSFPPLLFVLEILLASYFTLLPSEEFHHFSCALLLASFLLLTFSIVLLLFPLLFFLNFTFAHWINFEISTTFCH